MQGVLRRTVHYQYIPRYFRVCKKFHKIFWHLEHFEQFVIGSHHDTYILGAINQIHLSRNFCVCKGFKCNNNTSCHQNILLISKKGMGVFLFLFFLKSRGIFYVYKVLTLKVWYHCHFFIYGRFGAIRKPNAWSVKLMFSLKVTFYLTKTESRTEKPLIQLPYYCFE